MLVELRSYCNVFDVDKLHFNRILKLDWYEILTKYAERSYLSTAAKKNIFKIMNYEVMARSSRINTSSNNEVHLK